MQTKLILLLFCVVLLGAQNVRADERCPGGTWVSTSETDPEDGHCRTSCPEGQERNEETGECEVPDELSAGEWVGYILGGAALIYVGGVLDCRNPKEGRNLEDCAASWLWKGEEKPAETTPPTLAPIPETGDSTTPPPLVIVKDDSLDPAKAPPSLPPAPPEGTDPDGDGDMNDPLPEPVPPPTEPAPEGTPPPSGPTASTDTDGDGSSSTTATTADYYADNPYGGDLAEPVNPLTAEEVDYFEATCGIIDGVATVACKLTGYGCFAYIASAICRGIYFGVAMDRGVEPGADPVTLFGAAPTVEPGNGGGRSRCPVQPCVEELASTISTTEATERPRIVDALPQPTYRLEIEIPACEEIAGGVQLVDQEEPTYNYCLVSDKGPYQILHTCSETSDVMLINEVHCSACASHDRERVEVCDAAGNELEE